MTKPKDDLEAVRVVVDTLHSFDSADRERIIRWAREKLGMPEEVPAERSTSLSEVPSATPAEVPGQPRTASDIGSFIAQKDPKSDSHLAAVVAYYYHFEAPPEERRESIGKDEFIDACRKGKRTRPSAPSQTLINAFNAGLLDKSGERGRYRLNSVGENLVAMVLPESESSATPRARRAKPRSTAKRRSASKKGSGPKKTSSKKTKRKAARKSKA